MLGTHSGAAASSPLASCPCKAATDCSNVHVMRWQGRQQTPAVDKPHKQLPYLNPKPTCRSALFISPLRRPFCTNTPYANLPSPCSCHPR